MDIKMNVEGKRGKRKTKKDMDGYI